MPEEIRNVGASVRARLQILSRETAISEKSQAMVALRPGSLADVITRVARFIMPHAIAAAKIGRSY